MGHTAWAPEGREGRYQAGPKGPKTPRRAAAIYRYLVWHRHRHRVWQIYSVTNIYSSIRSYNFFFYKYIRTFVSTNIFGHSFMSVFEYSYNSQYEYLFGHSFLSSIVYEYIRIFFRIKFVIQIYSDIHSCQNFHEYHTLLHVFILSFLPRIGRRKTKISYSAKIREQPKDKRPKDISSFPANLCTADALMQWEWAKKLADLRRSSCQLIAMGIFISSQINVNDVLIVLVRGCCDDDHGQSVDRSWLIWAVLWAWVQSLTGRFETRGDSYWVPGLASIAWTFISDHLMIWWKCGLMETQLNRELSKIAIFEFETLQRLGCPVPIAIATSMVDLITPRMTFVCDDEAPSFQGWW